MKIRMSSFCSQCFAETEQTKEDYEKLKKELPTIETDWEVEVNDENLYEYNCPKGHRTFARLQEEKFEILFDLAAMALLDGYSREAVTGFASALERFIEFYILVISLKNNVSIENYQKMWKSLSKQSERQLGAFYALYLLENDKEIKLEQKWVEFRNKATHKGTIPPALEATEYGEYVLSLIRTLLKELRDSNEEHLEKARVIQLIKISEKIRFGTASIPTIINLRSIADPNFGNTSFRDALQSMKENSFYKHFYRKSI